MDKKICDILNEFDNNISKKYKTAEFKFNTNITPSSHQKYNSNNNLTSIFKSLINIDFTSGQKELLNMFIDNLNNDFSDKKLFCFSGRAGTGKTLTLSFLLKICEELGIRTLTGTFTGKASQVLREKGVNSDTLHSIMYKPITNDRGEIIGWEKNYNINCDILFIDEFSMLPDDMINDILNYDKVTIFFGDNAQLPPVKAEHTYLVDKVDLELKDICRQADGNPIIKWANKVRNGDGLPKNIKEKSDDGLFATLPTNSQYIERLKQEYDLIICGKNKTRERLNQEIRFYKNFSGILNEGEKLVILKNDKNKQVFNGQIIEVKKIISNEYYDSLGFKVIDIMTDDAGSLTICLDTLEKQDFNFNVTKKKKPKNYSYPIFVNYGWALTVHKCQGTEGEKVLLFADDLKFMYYMHDDKDVGKEMYSRALYTGITRAKKNCVVVI